MACNGGRLCGEREGGDEGVDEDVGEFTSGSRTRVSERCVRGEIPASVRSPNALAKRLNPCCRITIDTSNPGASSLAHEIERKTCTTPTSYRIQR